MAAINARIAIELPPIRCKSSVGYKFINQWRTIINKWLLLGRASSVRVAFNTMISCKQDILVGEAVQSKLIDRQTHEQEGFQSLAWQAIQSAVLSLKESVGASFE